MNNIPNSRFIKPGLAIIVLVGFWVSLPGRLFNDPCSYVIEDKDGKLLNASIAADGQWRFPHNEIVPEKFKTCIITFEDKRFYYHPGVDPFAVIRAVGKNIKHTGVVQGGSTLNMQVIRLSQKSSKRSLWNKLKEAILAIRLQCTYSKNEVLALYASNAPFGSNVVGLDAAAWRYFGRSPASLSWGEMASLAVLPNAPSLVHPGKNREVLLKKRNRLLDLLLANKKIDSSTCMLARLEPLPGSPVPLPNLTPHLLQRVRKDNRLTVKGVRIVTSIDGALQKNVAAILQQHQAVFKGNGINNACALVLDVETGSALAYVGNIHAPGDREMESDVDVITARRSPGSTLKPILYASMMSDGQMLPDALVPDIPMQVGSYAPKNFDLEYDGAVPASKALARSLNVPAVKLLQQYKYQRFYETLQEAGITTLNRPADHYGLSLILGGCEVTMWDLAGVYASMARRLNHQNEKEGRAHWSDFHPASYLSTPSANKASKQTVALDLTSIWFTFKAMQEVMRPGEEGLWQQFASAQSIAWKTGTSFGFRDGWAIGVTPSHVVAVWVGNTDGEGRPGLIGLHTAAPILFDIFRQLPPSEPFRQPRSNYEYIPVCRQTGFRANIDCNQIDTLLMPPNSLKSPLCVYHRIVHLDETGKFRVTQQCENSGSIRSESWFVLSPAMEYYYRQKNADYKPLPPFRAGCDLNEVGLPMEIIYPQAGAKIYVPLGVTGAKGETIFTAAHRRPAAKIFWSLDDHFLAATENFHQLAMNPAVGDHLLTLVDENGASVSRSFTILEKDTH